MRSPLSRRVMASEKGPLKSHGTYWLIRAPGAGLAWTLAVYDWLVSRRQLLSGGGQLSSDGVAATQQVGSFW